MQQQGYQQYRPSAGPQRRRRGLFVRILPWLIILAVLVSGGFFAVRAIRDKRVADEVAPYASVFADNISIDGLSISGMTAQEAYDQLYKRQQGLVDSWQMDISFKGHNYARVSYQTLGLSVQSDQIVQRLKEAWDLTHTGNNYQIKESIEALREQPYAAYTTQSELSDQKLEQLLTAIADNIQSFYQPRDAALIQFLPDNTDPFLIQPEASGYLLDVAFEKQEIMTKAASGTSGSHELQPKLVEPSVTEQQIRSGLTLRGEATTSIDRSSAVNRDNNIRVSLGKVNGTVLKPNAEFSFNGIVGKRTHENGFFDALEYVSGDLVTGIGGGVCQSSTTIYQAALLAGMGGFKRTPHSDPVNYTDKGLDATVYYYGGREIDFKFKNTSGGDIYMTAHVLGNNKRNLVARVRIYGPSLGEGVRYGLKTELLETLKPSPDTIYRKDVNAEHVLYKDQTEVLSKARDGYVVETFLEKYVNGQRVDMKWISKDTYQARQRVEWIGTKERP